MLRVRIVAVAFLVALVAGLLFLPVMYVWTFTAGDTATARVTGCRIGRHVTCHGTWQDATGRRGSGRIHGVGPDDQGRTVAVRIGPLGTYAGGPGHWWMMTLTALPIPLFPPFMIVAMRKIRGPGRGVARRLLAEPPGDAMVLSVPHTWADGAVGVTELDGSPRLSLAGIEAPPGFQPVELPGRRLRQKQKSAFDAAAGIGRTATSFAAASDPGGSPVFVLERRGSAEFEPETWLLDIGWAPQAVIRRVDWFPARYELLRADGGPLGTIAPPEGVRSGAFVVRDHEGRQVAIMAVEGRRWVVRVEPGVPPLLRDLTFAYALDAARLQM